MYSRLSSLNSRPNIPYIINSRKSETSEFEAHITLSFESINVVIWFGLYLPEQAFELHVFKAYRIVDDILLRIAYVWFDMYSDIVKPLIQWLLKENIFKIRSLINIFVNRSKRPDLGCLELYTYSRCMQALFPNGRRR